MNKAKQKLLLLTIIVIFVSCKNNETINVNQNTEDTEQTTHDKKDQKICEEFKINYTLSTNSIDVSIVTDLPDYIEISIDVSRSYWEKGNPETEYSQEYFSEFGTVGQWKNSRKITLTKKIWESNLAANQKEMAAKGLGYDVAKISDSITVYAVVTSSNAPEPIFKNGKAGQDEIALYYPINGKIKTQSKYGNPQSLEKEKTYSVSKTTPLMPELNPADPTDALSKVIELKTTSRIKIISVINKKNGMPWYEVKAFDKNNKSIGIGWINSIALIGQELKIIE